MVVYVGEDIIPHTEFIAPESNGKRSHLKDLGVTLSDNGNFQQQIDNITMKASTYTTSGGILLCTLEPRHGLAIRKLEAVQRTFTARMTGMRNMNYRDRLKHLKLYSLERRRERYFIICIWEIISRLVPNLEKERAIRTVNRGRRGLMCIIPPISTRWTRLQTLKENYIAVQGPGYSTVHQGSYDHTLETCKLLKNE